MVTNDVWPLETAPNWSAWPTAEVRVRDSWSLFGLPPPAVEVKYAEPKFWMTMRNWPFGTLQLPTVGLALVAHAAVLVWTLVETFVTVVVSSYPPGGPLEK